MRMSGLVSGMDIDELVKNMLKPEQLRIDKVLKEKTKVTWRQEALNDTNSTLAKFILDTKNDFGLTKTADGLFENSISNTTWSKLADITNSAIASVSASATSANGSYDINVHNLAENWSAASSASVLKPTGANIQEQLGLNVGDKIDITLTTPKGTVRITNDATIADGTGVIKIDAAKDTLSTLSDKINSAAIGVSASFDAGIGRFFLQTTDTGAANTITITEAAGSVNLMTGAGKLNLQTKVGDVTTTVQSATKYAGIDALIDVGLVKGITQSSNSFSINGVNYSLKSIGTATVRVSSDIDGAVKKITKFVEDYNKLVDKLNTAIKDKYDRQYQPLTDEEKKAMSQDQIKLWEEKAKKGLLNNNDEIYGMLINIRQNLFKDVAGLREDINSITDIGIDTEAFNYNTGGKLVIDENKLREALQKDSNSVMQVLFKTESASDPDITGKTNMTNTGLINQMYTDIIDGMKKIVNKAGVGDNANLYRNVQSNILIDFVVKQGSISVMQKEIDDYQSKVKELQTKFTVTQTRYYNQFTQMEKAIQLANSQSSWLTQQFK